MIFIPEFIAPPESKTNCSTIISMRKGFCTYWFFLETPNSTSRTSLNRVIAELPDDTKADEDGEPGSGTFAGSNNGLSQVQTCNEGAISSTSLGKCRTDSASHTFCVRQIRQKRLFIAAKS